MSSLDFNSLLAKADKNTNNACKVSELKYKLSLSLDEELIK